jgi:hypothetical protein
VERIASSGWVLWGHRDNAFGASQHRHVDHLAVQFEDAPLVARRIQYTSRPSDLAGSGA